MNVQNRGRVIGKAQDGPGRNAIREIPDRIVRKTDDGRRPKAFSETPTERSVAALSGRVVPNRSERVGGMLMTDATGSFAIEVQKTEGRCPIGETVGQRNIREARIPVLSCEGGCIRGEIARLAANMVGEAPEFARGCHGELMTVPDSAIAQWIRAARKVVLIDGCFLSCHGRILEGLLERGQLAYFDALTIYKKYTDVFDINEVAEAERTRAARQVADAVLAGFAAEGGTDADPS